MIKTSLFADQEREAKLNKLGDALKVMERHVDFVAFADAVDEAAPRPGRERGGRPPFPTELMVRVLLIQQLFNLSDEQMEFQLLDRLSFQRFVGLRSSSQIPDRTTIWTFKERLLKAISLYTTQPCPSRIDCNAVATSITRCNPCQIVLTPGSPSLLRPRKPPSWAINRAPR